MKRTDRIAIVGAGPGGLSTAWYLNALGFHNVVVLEQQARVGGLARTVTHAGKPFELGANLITMAYTHVMEVAHAVGADTVIEGEYVALVDEGERARLEPILPAVLRGSSVWAFAIATMRYTWARLWVARHVDQPTWSGLAAHPDLCGNFYDWLVARKAEALAPLFRIPITTMGYGPLDAISAAHALKYMSLATFLPTVIRGLIGPLKFLVPYPRRFEHGFQRLFEAMCWRLDVRTGVTIQRITRTDRGVTIRFAAPRQSMTTVRDAVQDDVFDAVILAVRPTLAVLEGLMDLDDEERGIFGEVRTYGYCMVSTQVHGLVTPEPVIVTVPPKEPGEPSAIVKQYAEDATTQFYTVLPGWNPDDAEALLWPKIDRLVAALGATRPPEATQWSSFDQWPYFPHVSNAAMAGGWYDRFEALQGKRRTYYAGAIGSFELVEPIFAYSKHLAQRIADAR